MIEMNFITGLTIYWFISGYIYLTYFMTKIRYEDEFKDMVRDVRWNTGYKDNTIIFTAAVISFIGGWFLLPKKILELVGLIEGDS